MHVLRQISGRRPLWIAAIAFAAVACDSTTEPSTPSQIAITTGATITGKIGTPATVTVAVSASNGNKLSNQPVTFTVSTGGGTVTPATTNTDANGQATAVWAFGNTLGAQTLSVTSGSVTQVVTATVSAGAPASITATAGNGQTATAGTAVATPPAVTVKDAAGNPVSGVQVTFASTPGGSVTPASVTTDASGVARVTTWTLGAQAGTYTLTATALSPNVTGNPLAITATATSGAASRIQAGTNLPASAPAGSALPTAQLPSATVVDANGNPVANVAVTFTVTSGGGTITNGTANTNAQGVATVGGFRLGNTAGPNVITATATGAGSATLAVTGTAGPAATTQIVSGNNQAVAAGQPLPVGPSVKVIDQFGNAVSGATVNFVVTSGGGAVLGGTQTTNAQGVATVGGWTLGPLPGANTLAARVNGVADVTFTATGLAGAPATLTKVSGDSAQVVAFRTAAAPVVVLVRDAAGFPVQGATVNFGLSNSAGGSLSAATVTTNAQGQASTTFTANGVLGNNTISATVGTLPVVTFTVTTVQNSAGSVTVVQGNNQSATIGTNVAVNPTVLVRDAAGLPVPNVTVYFDVFGQGAVQFPVAQTDVNGIATSGAWTLGTTAGTNTLAATVGAAQVSGNPIIFTATAVTVPNGAAIAVVPGTPATAPANSSLSPAVQVTVNGAPVANLSVLFSVVAGGGNIGGQQNFTTTTDSQGIARVPSWVLGSGSAILNRLTANVVTSGLTVVIDVTTQ